MNAHVATPAPSIVVLPLSDVPAGVRPLRVFVRNQRNPAQWIKLPLDARADMIENVLTGKRATGWDPVVVAECSEQAVNAARILAPVQVIEADGVRPATPAETEAHRATLAVRALPPVFAPALTLVQTDASQAGVAEPPAPWSAGAQLDVTPRGVRMQRVAHDQLPQAREALRALRDEVVVEDRRDVVVGVADLRLTDRVELSREATEDREALLARVEGAGLGRLQSELRSALGGVGDLGVTTLAGSAEPALRAAGAATWNVCAGVLAERERRGSTRAQVTLRTRRVAQAGGERRPQVYAVVSERYGEVDADKIATACLRLAERVGGDLRAAVAYDREAVRIDLSTCELTGEVQVGDTFRSVLRVRSNDAGRGGLHVHAIAERLACKNGAVIAIEGAHTVIRHLGDAARLQERLREALAAATGALRGFSRQWVAATARPIVDGIEALERDQRAALAGIVDEVITGQALADLGLRPAGQALLEGAYRGILRQHELAPVKQLEEHVSLLRAAHWDSRNAGGARDSHGGLSRAALANGLTLWSQSQPMAIAHEAEVVAGRVISGEEVLGWIARKE